MAQNSAVMTGRARLAALFWCAAAAAISAQTVPAGAGAVFLVVFVVVRAASFHHVDILLRSEALGLRVNALLELSGIACIGWNARNFSHKRLRQKRQPE